MRRLALIALILLSACGLGPGLAPLGAGGGTSPATSLYLREIVGRYAPAPICAGQEFQVEFAPDSVYLGETGCNIAAMRPIPGGVALDLAACRAEGTPAPARSLEVTPQPDGSLTLASPARTRSVQPCFD